MLIFQIFCLKFCFPFSLRVLRIELSSLSSHCIFCITSCICFWSDFPQILKSYRGDHVVWLLTKTWLTWYSQGLPNCHYNGFLWVQRVNCGGRWDASSKSSVRKWLVVPDLGVLSGDGLQLSAPSGTPWAAWATSPGVTTFPGAHIHRLIVEEGQWSGHLAPKGATLKTTPIP